MKNIFRLIRHKLSHKIAKLRHQDGKLWFPNEMPNDEDR
jgi:hypothetical protein